MQFDFPFAAPRHPVASLPLAAACFAAYMAGFYGSAYLATFASSLASNGAAKASIYMGFFIIWVIAFGLAAAWAIRCRPRRWFLFWLSGSLAAGPAPFVTALITVLFQPS